MPQQKNRRIGALDELRGLLLLLMIFYHGAYDAAVIFGFHTPLFFSKPMHWLQVFLASGFIIISGMSARFSRNNAKHGIVVLGCGLLLTATTAIAMPDQLIWFGVLHFLGGAMLLFALCRPLLDRIPTPLGAPLFVALFILTLYLPQGMLGYPPFWTALPAALYQTPYLFPLGFPSPTFVSSDYVPLLPNLFLFFGASYLGIYAQRGQLPSALYPTRVRWLAWVGRHTLPLYMIHQPIVYGLLWVCFTVFPTS